MSAGPPPRRPWFFWSRRAPPPRILGLLQFHNAMRYPRGYFENVAPHVDGIIALDDRSTDGSGEFVASQPPVLELVRVSANERQQWDERANRRLLVQTSWRYQPDWLIAVDADERVERDFRGRARTPMASATALAIAAATGTFASSPIAFTLSGPIPIPPSTRTTGRRGTSRNDGSMYTPMWPERLNPGAVRNLGVASTRAPYIAFLAADCIAEPGWVSGRLREHRSGALAVASAVTNACPPPRLITG